METICLGGKTAWEAWRVARRVLARQNPPNLLSSLLFLEHPAVDSSTLPTPLGEFAPPSRIDVSELRDLRAQLDAEGFSAELDLLASSRAGRTDYGCINVGLCSWIYPAGSFFCTAESLLLPHPGLIAAQLARSGGASDLVVLKLLTEACGYFVPDDTAPAGLLGCPPLCSVSPLSALFERIAVYRHSHRQRLPAGMTRVQRLLGLAAERAASPGEARLTWLLSLPHERGGYGLPWPQLNVLTRLGADGTVLFGLEDVVCDLTWPDQLAMDYQGADTHKARTRRIGDEEKRICLQSAGYACVQVFKEQLGSLRRMDALAGYAASALGVRGDLFDPEFATARLMLRREVLAPWDAGLGGSLPVALSGEGNGSNGYVK